MSKISVEERKELQKEFDQYCEDNNLNYGDDGSLYNEKYAHWLEEKVLSYKNMVRLA